MNKKVSWDEVTLHQSQSALDGITEALKNNTPVRRKSIQEVVRDRHRAARVSPEIIDYLARGLDVPEGGSPRIWSNGDNLTNTDLRNSDIFFEYLEMKNSGIRHKQAIEALVKDYPLSDKSIERITLNAEKIARQHYEDQPYIQYDDDSPSPQEN